jgi:hypothetical protein
MTMLRTVSLTLAIAVGGCATDDEYRYGGEIQTTHLAVGTNTVASGTVFLYSDYVPATGEPEPSTFPYSSIPIDTCIPRPVFPGDGQYVGLDAGPAVDVVGAGGTLTLQRTTDPEACSGSSLCYLSDFVPGTTIPAGSIADVTWPGSEHAAAATWAEAIQQPAPIVVTQPDPALAELRVTPDADLAFRWEPGTSDVLLIAFLTSEYQICLVTDDGAFDVPAATVARSMPAAGTIAIVRGDITTRKLGDRTVNIIPLTGRGWTVAGE